MKSFLNMISAAVYAQKIGRQPLITVDIEEMLV